MKYKSLLIVIALMFFNLNGMEEDVADNLENYSIDEVLHRPKTLVNIVSKFLANKLIDDIKAEVDDDKVVSYEKYLASCPLNQEAKLLVLNSLFKNENRLLWNVLPYSIIPQNMTLQCQDIIAIDNDQLLVLYNEPSESPHVAPNSKIKMWDMRSQGWVDDIPLHDITVYNWLISKDLKTLFLLCYGSFIDVYDLVHQERISIIISSPHVIKSFCLLNNDKFVCCGLIDGTVALFDKDSGQKIFSFKAADTAITFIDGIDDVIVTVDSWCVRCWKLAEDKEAGYKPAMISSFLLEGEDVRNIKLGLDGNAMIINFNRPDQEIVELYETNPWQLLNRYNFCPSFVGFTRNQDSTMLFAGEGKRNFFGSYIWDAFKALILLDAESGEIIRRFDLENGKELLGDNKSPIGWKGFAIAPDNSFIVLFDKQGQIAKINLNLGESLESILEKIKLDFVKKKAALQSRCLIS